MTSGGNNFINFLDNQLSTQSVMYAFLSSVLLRLFGKYPTMGVTLYRWSDMA